ncbi:MULTISPECIES: Flp pilus assembly protein CpaB [Thermomonosporaceae]|uniref:Flp pilus assembly protein CpaB n=1 Tax=Thermomonosporaceae TaxID=2012 RepID=UPI00255AA1BB|nr:MULTISPECIES: Flp pilus assembly protein CpaB [Thermomonosporaceae]MDL4772217.1 Flp pilus assembly protein CpaB [Actinomadura xylanilytica]
MNPRQRRGVLLMTVAVVGAAAVFVMVLGYVNQVRSEVGRMTGVLQLQSEVEPFQPIQDGMLRRVQVPEKYLPATFIADPAEIQGKVAASVLPKGAYLQQGMLSDAPDLKPGQREIAITIDAETGVAGKVYPGAIVDVYATFSGGNSASCAVRVLNRVQIIDVGQLRTEQGKEAGGGGATVVPVTFALDPDATLSLTYAESFAGKVRLALVGGQSDAKPPTNQLCKTPKAAR